MSRRLFCAALACIAFAACGKSSDYWMDKLDAEPLHVRQKELAGGPSCAALVPMEFAQTYPVPAEGGHGAFAVLFYQQTPESYATTHTLYAPRFQGEFTLADGADRCFAVPNSAPKALGNEPVPAMSVAEYYRLQDALYGALPKAAELYESKAEPGTGDRATLAAFADAFTKLAEPLLLPYYYRLNPDFWEWLRRQTGKSIPPAD